MKKSNKRNSRLKYLIILLLLTAIIFGSSTYAWFTTNKTVTVSSIDINVQAVDGIQISVDGINWKSTITKAELLAATTTYSAAPNKIPEQLEPVSTALTYDGTTGLLNMYYGDVKANETTGNYELYSVKNANTDEKVHYIVFDVFLKTTTNIPNLYLTTDSGASYVGTSVGLENATRIAMIKQGNTTAGAATSTIQGLVTSSASDAYLWEPNYKSHTAASVSNAAAMYGINTSTNPANNELIPYSGINAVIPTVDGEGTPVAGIPLADCTETDNADYFLDVVPTYTTETGFASNLKVFGLSAGITKLRVYMWIEGQDIDCENNASGTDVQFDLKFTIDE